MSTFQTAQTLIDPSLDGLWHWIRSKITTERAPVALSILALLVAIWSGISAKRGVRAAERSANAAATQAVSAEEQARSAQQQADIASEQTWQQKKIAEVDALAAAKDRIDQVAPRIVIAIDSIRDTPLIAPSAFEVPVPHPPVVVADSERYVEWEDWHFDVYLLATGTVFNSGADAVRIFPMELRFVEGKHPVTGEAVSIPQKTQSPEPAAVLYPGQLACFELLVQRQVWDWNDAAEAKTYPVKIKKTAIAIPGSTDEPMLSVELDFSIYGSLTKVIEPTGNDARVGDLLASVPKSCGSTCEVKYHIGYPDSFDQLHAEMTKDEVRLEDLRRERWNRESMKAIIKRMREGRQDVPADAETS